MKLLISELLNNEEFEEMKKFTCDFETTVDENDCRVWAYSICEIGNFDNFIYGNNIEDFIKWCQDKRNNYLLYFHNLKFDGQFIISYLLNNGYTYIKSKEDVSDKTFTSLIGDMGEFYSIEIFFDTHNKKHINKVTIYDSLKILNMSVSDIAKGFNLPIRKLEIDYKAKREIGHVLTNEEIDYIRNDVEIMARALDIMFQEGLTKMTIGSDALNNYKEFNKNFKKYFPILAYEIDQDIRKSYKGGFTYLNDCYKEKEVGEGIVLDVNSLYPSVMMNEKLPYGEPIFFEGKYEEDMLYPLYIQKISCSFDIKPDKIPMIQIKNNISYIPNEYVKSTGGDIVTLTLTSIDLKLFLENYNVYDIEYQNGWKFKCVKGLFKGYIDYWSNRKIQAKKDDNKAIYKISKLMLNSLYGKFGLNPQSRTKSPYLDDEGVVRYATNEIEIREPVYIPMASFITAYARNKTIRTSQKIKDWSMEKYGKDLYCYSDTDSIHACLKSTTNKETGEITLVDKELYNELDIDDFILGYWKVESKFVRAKFIRQKCYIELSEVVYNSMIQNKMNVTVSGLPKSLGEMINFTNFNKGFTTEGMEFEKKLTYKHVKGGVILVETDFTIK